MVSLEHLKPISFFRTSYSHSYTSPIQPKTPPNAVVQCFLGDEGCRGSKGELTALLQCRLILRSTVFTWFQWETPRSPPHADVQYCLGERDVGEGRQTRVDDSQKDGILKGVLGSTWKLKDHPTCAVEVPSPVNTKLYKLPGCPKKNLSAFGFLLLVNFCIHRILNVTYLLWRYKNALKITSCWCFSKGNGVIRKYFQ